MGHRGRRTREGVRCEPRTGTAYGVLGPNGACKATTINMLATLLVVNLIITDYEGPPTLRSCAHIDWAWREHADRTVPVQRRQSLRAAGRGGRRLCRQRQQLMSPIRRTDGRIYACYRR